LIKVIQDSNYSPKIEKMEAISTAVKEYNMAQTQLAKATSIQSDLQKEIRMLQEQVSWRIGCAQRA